MILHPVAAKAAGTVFGFPTRRCGSTSPSDGPRHEQRGAGLSFDRTLNIATSFGLALMLATTPALAKSGQTTKSSTSKTHATSKATSHKTSTSKATVKKVSKKSSKKTKGGWRTRGQQQIDANRAREIQAALIRAHYLDGQPTGTWDPRSKAAMEKFQSDNGWQTKKIPDARALIKLGLGPDHSDLINPNTASIGTPDTIKGGGVPNNQQ